MTRSLIESYGTERRAEEKGERGERGEADRFGAKFIFIQGSGTSLLLKRALSL